MLIDFIGPIWLNVIDVDECWDVLGLIFFYFTFNVIDYKLFSFLVKLEINFLSFDDVI